MLFALQAAPDKKETDTILTLAIHLTSYNNDSKIKKHNKAQDPRHILSLLLRVGQLKDS